MHFFLFVRSLSFLLRISYYNFLLFMIFFFETKLKKLNYKCGRQDDVVPFRMKRFCFVVWNFSTLAVQSALQNACSDCPCPWLLKNFHGMVSLWCVFGDLYNLLSLNKSIFIEEYKKKDSWLAVTFMVKLNDLYENGILFLSSRFFRAHCG